MRIFGIGIDVVEISRIEESIQRRGETFLAKVFTRNERDYCDAGHRPGMRYAARFAAKEAVSKALGTGIGGRVGLLDVEVEHDSEGAPKVRLTGAAEQFLKQNGIREVQISLSHSGDYAVANALAISFD